MSYGTASDPNLRRRNDYFAPADGSFSDMSYPPYSELPFTSLKRRKQSTSFVKWTMRAVLASPIVVLVVYSTVAVLFSSKQINKNTTTTSINKQRRKTQNNRPQEQYYYNNNNNNVYDPYLFQQGQPQQQYMMVGQEQQQGGGQLLQLQQDTSQGGNVMMLAPNTQNQMMMNTQRQEQQQQTTPQVIMMNAAREPQPLQQHRNTMPVPQTTMESSQQAMMAEAPPSMGAAQNQMMQQQPQQQQVMTPDQFLATHPNLRQGKMLPVIPTMGSAAGEQAQPLGNAQVTQPMGNVQVTQPMGNTVPQGEAPMGQVRIEPLQGSPPDASANITQPNPLGKEASIYYYYPQHAVDSYGNVKVPSIIFDRNGSPVDLKALQGKQVYMEPPRRSIAAGSLPNWGDSSSQDQSIIVSTVAVMALLVGALSARRMRSRSFLSACIENESLEDDVAYDTAYTTTDHSYNTFGGWKGDLEKFDV
jgi:hypothetical protein